MHSIQEALNDAKRDEAANVDIGKLLAMLRVPLLDTLALPQACVKLDYAYAIHDLLLPSPASLATRIAASIPNEGPDIITVVSMASRMAGRIAAGAGGARASGTGWSHADRDRSKAHVNITGAFLLHTFITRNRRAELRGRGIDGREREDVQEEYAPIVQEMFDSTVCERELHIGKNRDDAYTVHAIDIWYNLYLDNVSG